MGHKHEYTLTNTWTGNTGEGTKDYRSFERSYTLASDGKPDILGSADPNYRGDKTRWNPEDLLVASLSACHKLWFLHLAAVNGIVVTDYVDEPLGTLNAERDGSGEFVSVVLRPRITITDPSMAEKADTLHHEAHEKCFIARSVNFPVTVDATYA
ncbi:MAG: OsmC family protein [Pseudomonadota bacterium]